MFRPDANTGTISCLAPFGFAQALRGIERRRDDRHIASTAADVPAEEFAQLGFARVRLVPHIPVESNQDARGAEAALQRVMTTECCLQNREPTGLRRKALDRADASAVGLHGEREAGARRYAIDLDGAGTAHAMLAADMGAGETETVAQEIGEQHAWFGVGLMRAAVDFQTDCMARVGAQARHRRASSMVMRPKRRTRLRR